MWILITRIEPSTTHDEIYRFAKKGLRGRWPLISPASRGRAKRCGILRISDRRSKFMECHGLVSIEPIKSAMEAIERLNGISFHGNPVTVRRYFSRSTERDRRNHFDQQSVPEHKDRRRSDRRRSHLMFRKDLRYYKT